MKSASGMSSNHRRTILIGVSSMLIGGGLVFLPLILGRGSLNRFIVVVGLLGFLLGASIAAHGVLDTLRRQ
ncbi:MAG TPA: hypothetical protein VL282_03750 [Tepidisphaeraceae bacterium]|nr:hypothetical protein [Tepidisphaeraceae bacterium]